MTVLLSSLCILLICLVTLNDAWIFGRRRSSIRLNGPNCDSKRNCVSCANHKSWSGQPCRWCPRDKKCHAYGAVLANPCSSSENVVNANACNKIVIPSYDRSLAFKMVYLSALAYANGVASFIPKAKEVNSFRLVRQVTRPCQGKAECSGFVAVSESEKAIAIAFRGSEHTDQVIEQSLQVLTVPKVRFQAGGRVQKYFNDVFLLIWDQLKYDVYRQIRRYSNYRVWVTGHSLGAALASLASTLLLYERRTPKNNLFLYTFGQPRVGNYDYALKHDNLVPISFRITHYRDPVVHLPTCKTLVPGSPACVSFTGGPYHHGKEIYYGNEVMTKYSSYKKCDGLPHNEDLKCSNNPAVWFHCFSPSGIKKCINDHTVYFGIDVGIWWSQNKSG